MKNYGDCYGPVPEKEVGEYMEDVYPTETAGDGKIRSNNIHTGGQQGKISGIYKARCQICGFPLDVSKNDTSGGSLDGDGAGGAVDANGDQAYRHGAGCPLCFSKHSTKEPNLIKQIPSPETRILPF